MRLLILLLLLTLPAAAQVNTEVLRRTAMTEGIETRLGINFAYNAGNTSFLKLSGNARVDYLSGEWYIFTVGNYERGLKDTLLFINRGFAHLRFVRDVVPGLRAELFGQTEFNEFIRLKDRNLVGLGGRITLLDGGERPDTASWMTLHLGIGGMSERETTSGEGAGTTALVRSTNYLSLSWHFDERSSFGMTGYLQPSLRDIDDRRALFDASLSFGLGGVLAWNSSIRYRHDTEPPPGIRPFDLELANGITATF
jgi:hypothetical protein